MRRRPFLAGIATGLAGGLAGCGYRHGGGDFRWSKGAGMFGPDFFAADGRRVLVGHRSVRDYDPGRGEWVTGGSLTGYDPAGEWILDRTFETPLGALSVVPEAVFALLADGTLARVEDGGSDEDVDSTVAWRVPALEAFEESDPDPFRDDEDPGPGPPLTVATPEVVYATDGDELTAVEGSGGDRRFRRSFEEQTTAVRPRPDAGGGYALLGSELLALDGTGEDRWRRQVGVAGQRSGTARSVTAEDATLHVDPDGVYVVAREGVRAFGHDGTGRWRRDLTTTLDPRPTLESGTLYVEGADGLSALSTDGTEEWTYGGENLTGTVAVAGHRVYATDGQALVAIEDGEPAWEVDLSRPDGFRFEDGPLLAGETVVLEGDRSVRGYWRRQP